jgi:phage terminase large subunit
MLNHVDEGIRDMPLAIDPAQTALNAIPETVSIEEALEHYIEHPVDWVQDIIGVLPDQWQCDVLNSLVSNKFVSVRSGHGVGKSCVDAWAVLWFLCTHPFCKVVATAPTKEQLSDILWAECYKWIRTSEKLSRLVEWQADRIVMRSHPEEWFAIARTAEVRKLGKTGLAVAESLQGRHAASIFYLIDEASGVDETIMSTIDGALTSEDSFVLMTGNPTRPSGTFYDSHHAKRTLWKTFHINSEDSPRVSRKWLAYMLEKYGSRDHPLYLIKVRGEFPPAQYNSVFDLVSIEECMKLTLPIGPYDYFELGVDVARYGGDSTAIAVKQGPVISSIDRYPQQSTMETAGRVIQYINKLRPVSVKVDVVGVGAGVVDRLHELGYKEVIAINGASAPLDEKAYFNTRAEAHWHLRTLMERRQIQLPKEDDELAAQMSSITYKVTSRGKILIESKEELRSRGVKSPDSLDAAILAAMPTAYANVARGVSFGHVAFMGR